VDDGPARLSATRSAWRVLVLLLGLVVLVGAQLRDTNDWFPLGSLSQYATPRASDGTVVATYLEGTTDDGEVVQVPLSPGSVGLSRSELESQQLRVVDHPELLGDLARSRAALHPSAPRLAQLRLVRSSQRLQDATAVGAPELTVLAEWSR
jgi:hypothetical protein